MKIIGVYGTSSESEPDREAVARRNVYLHDGKPFPMQYYLEVSSPRLERFSSHSGKITGHFPQEAAGVTEGGKKTLAANNWGVDDDGSISF